MPPPPELDPLDPEVLPPPELDVLLDPVPLSPQHIHIEGSPQDVSWIVLTQMDPVDWQVPPSCKQVRPVPELDPLDPPELLELLGAPELLLDEVAPPQQIPPSWLPGSPGQLESYWGSGLAHGWFGWRHVPPTPTQSNPAPELEVLPELGPPELEVLPELGPPELLLLDVVGSAQQVWGVRSPQDMSNWCSGLAHGNFGSMHQPPADVQSVAAPELDVLPPELDVLPPDPEVLPPDPEVLPPELDVLPPPDPEVLPPDPPELVEVPLELVEPLEAPELPPSRSSPIGSVLPPHAATTGSKTRYRRNRIQCADGRCDWSMPLIGQCSVVL